MVVDTLNPNATAATSGRGKAKVILADAASIQTYREGSKNIPMNVSVIPKLYAHVIEKLAQEPANLEVGDNKTAIKRAVYSAAIRVAIAKYFDYAYEKASELMIPTTRGTAGLVNIFKTQVQNMFELAASIGQMADLNEDQIKKLSFDKARESLATHPQLSSIELTDELLEALWSGGDIEAEDDDDDGEEEATEENTAPAPVAPAQFS